MNHITLITGGIKSGKSKYALELAASRGHHFDPAILFSGNSAQKQKKRMNESVHLATAISQAQFHAQLVLIDSLTTWMDNLLYFYAGQPKAVEREIRGLIGVAGERRTSMIFVTNEISFDVSPTQPFRQKFSEELGQLNQAIAKMADEVVLMISGIPQTIQKQPTIAQF